MSIHFFRTGRASVDLGAIRIGDKPATGMSREQVFDELYNLRVPGIASTMGKQEMLLRFVDWQAEHEDAIAGKSEQPIIETVVDGQLSQRNLKIAAPKNFSGSAFCCSLYAATPRDRLLRNGILWRRLSIGGGLDPDMLQFRR